MILDLSRASVVTKGAIVIHDARLPELARPIATIAIGMIWPGHLLAPRDWLPEPIPGTLVRDATTEDLLPAIVASIEFQSVLREDGASRVSLSPRWIGEGHRRDDLARAMDLRRETAARLATKYQVRGWKRAS